MGHTVITIGRQYGSGGHEIGEKLAARLGISFYDKKLLEIAARETGLDINYLREIDEKPSSLLFTLASGANTGLTATGAFTGLPMADQVFISLSKLVQGIAAKESCVIVGRAADYILRDTDAINVFIHAELEHRIKRVMERNGISEDKARDLIQKTDKERASYYNRYVGKKWGALTNYHLSIDSGLLGIDGTVDLILNCATKK